MVTHGDGGRVLGVFFGGGGIRSEHPRADCAPRVAGVWTPLARTGSHILPESKVPHVRRQRSPCQDSDGEEAGFLKRGEGVGGGPYAL